MQQDNQLDDPDGLDSGLPADGDKAGSRAPAVNRAIAIMRLLIRSREPLGVNAIARELNIVPSTCHHILRALEGENLVSVNGDDKRYRIGLGIVALARQELNTPISPRIVQFELNRLASEFGVTATLVQFDGLKQKILTATSQIDTSFGIRVKIGYAMPAFSSASGRCLAAFSNISHKDLRREFEQLTWESEPSFATWLSEIDDARVQGYAADRSNWVKGFTVLAVPVFRNNRITQSIAAIFATSQLSEQQQKDLAVAVCQTGRRLSA